MGAAPRGKRATRRGWRVAARGRGGEGAGAGSALLPAVPLRLAAIPPSWSGLGWDGSPRTAAGETRQEIIARSVNLSQKNKSWLNCCEGT